jgi:hypothetical protein
VSIIYLRRLGLWIAADDPVPNSKPNKASRKTKMLSPFEFVGPALQVPEVPHGLSAQKVGVSWRQRVQNKKL